MSTDFFLSLTVFEIKGAHRGRKRHFEELIKFSFFIQFWWDFFHWIPLNEIFKNACSRFFLSLTVFEIKRAKGAKMPSWGTHKIFIFHSILIGFLHWIFLNESFKNGYSRFFSNSYRFRDKRGPKGQKHHFEGLVKLSLFIQFWRDFFH